MNDINNSKEIGAISRMITLETSSYFAYYLHSCSLWWVKNKYTSATTIRLSHFRKLYKISRIRFRAFWYCRCFWSMANKNASPRLTQYCIHDRFSGRPFYILLEFHGLVHWGVGRLTFSILGFVAAWKNDLRSAYFVPYLDFTLKCLTEHKTVVFTTTLVAFLQSFSISSRPSVGRFQDF